MNRVRVTVDDLRRAVEFEVGRNWSDGAWLRWLDAAAVLRDQSFRNVVLIRLQMPGAAWVDGRQGWQRNGRHVMRGASGIRTFAAAVERDRSADPVQGHGVATVWDVSQTDGVPLRTAESVSSQVAFAALEKVASTRGYRVERRQPVAGKAETGLRRRRIVVPDDLDAPMALMCLAHELAHLRMHKWAGDSGCQGVVRLEAGSVAYVLLARLGCLPDLPSADFVVRPAGVVGRTPPVRLIETLGGRVVATAGRLFDAAEQYLLPYRSSTRDVTP
ncbi:MAG TPA: hypothetical protein VFH20_09680, partial [Propionibacteriaceae bacterium]|nr:hypothetical protein [Propionibacteriaceae bacterium]